jgi:hypothetical protein
MWTQVSMTDTAGLSRHVAIMQQMDHRYAKLASRDLVMSILERQGEVWHYQGQGFDIGMALQYRQERQEWELAQLGFVGQVQVSQVLDLVIQKGLAFTQAHGISSLSAVRPNAIDYQPLETFYQLCAQDTRIRITAGRQVVLGTVWHLAYAGP